MLIATANPCKCRYLSDPSQACAHVPLCDDEYMARLSEPIMDRFDLAVEMPPVAFHDLDLPSDSDTSATVTARVAAAFQIQTDRYRDYPDVQSNADLEGVQLTEVATSIMRLSYFVSRRVGIIGFCASGAPSLIGWCRASRADPYCQGTELSVGPADPYPGRRPDKTAVVSSFTASDIRDGPSLEVLMLRKFRAEPLRWASVLVGGWMKFLASTLEPDSQPT